MGWDACRVSLTLCATSVMYAYNPASIAYAADITSSRGQFQSYPEDVLLTMANNLPCMEGSNAQLSHLAGPNHLSGIMTALILRIRQDRTEIEHRRHPV